MGGLTISIPEAPRILVLRLSALGDVLVAMRAVTVLRHGLPRAHLTWVVEDRHADLLRGYPDVDEVVVFERRRMAGALGHPRALAPAVREARRFLRRLRSPRHDLVLDFQGNLKSAVLSLASRSRVRIGFDRRHCREGNHLFNNVHVRLSDGTLHREDRDLGLLAPLGIPDRGARPTLRPRDEDHAFADRFLAGAVRGGRPVAVLHPGTSGFGGFKRWPAPSFATLGDRIVRRLGWAVLVTWGPGEEALARSVVAGMEERGILSAPTAGLLQAAALLLHAAVYVGADTGITHLAARLGIPTVALFGPKDPRIYAPRGPHVRVLVRDLDCRPCGLRRCRFDDPVCMTGIEPDRVLQAIRELDEARSA